jgi:hypothetical protein
MLDETSQACPRISVVVFQMHALRFGGMFMQLPDL